MSPTKLTNPAKPDSNKAPRWQRNLAVSVLGMLLIAVITIGSLVALLSTEKGSQWLLALANDKVELFDYQHASGNLADGLQISHLQIHAGDTRIDIASLKSRWQFWELLRGRFSISQLHVQKLDIHLSNKQDQTPTAPGAWPTLSLPLPIAIKDLMVHELSIYQGDSIQLIEAIKLQASISPLGLTVNNVAVQKGEQQLALQGEIAAAFPYPIKLNIHWQSTLNDKQQLRGEGSVSGNLHTLNIQHQLLSPYVLHTKGELALAVDDAVMQIDPDTISVDIHNQWPQTRIAVGADDSLQSQGQLDIKGRFDRYVLSFNSRLAAQQKNGTAPQNNGAAPTKATPTNPPESLVQTALAKPSHISINVQGNKLALQLSDSSVESHLGKLVINGKADANALLNGGGPVSWDISTVLQNITLEKLLPQWPAVINANAVSQGQWQDDKYTIAVNLKSLKGELRGNRIDGKGNIAITETSQSISNFTVNIGDNALRVTGTRQDNIDLNWNINAPKLAQLYKGLSGQLMSRGELSGSLSAPKVNATAEGKYLKFDGNKLDTATLNANIQKNVLDLQLQLSGIEAAALKDAELAVNIQGNMNRHSVSSQLHNGMEHLTLDLSGGLKDQRWQGEISRLNINSSTAGDWQLKNPAPLYAAADNVQLEDFCLQQKQASICNQLRWQNQTLTTKASLNNVAIENFIQGMPEGSGVSGRLNAELNAEGPITALKAEVKASIDSLLMRYKPAEDEALVEFDGKFSLAAQSDGKKATAQSRFSLAEFGELNAQLSMDALNADANLQGEIQAGFSNLQWLGSLLPQLEKLDGKLDSNINIAGQLSKPVIAGEVSLQALRMDIPDLGLNLRDGELSAKVDNDSQWQTTAKVMSKDSVLSLSGQGSLDGKNGPVGTLTVTGDRFLLADTDDLRAMVSPNIDIQLKDEAIDIGGKLAINEGHYHLNALPSQAVDVSGDERIVSKGPENQLGGRPLNIEINLALDKSFTFKGLGFSTALGGNLRIKQKGDSAPQAYGSINLYDGLYKAYGQKLAVESGILIFQGPLDNPGLNITAVRETKDGTAGIRIGGYAQDIRSELFSNPAMSPTNTMAILVTGKAPSQMNQDDANQVANAATALGISQSAGISNTLRETFGVDVLSLQGGETYTESSLVVGKYLNPKLFVSYVQNLFTPVGAVQLEYSLTDNLGLKAQSGKEQSIDLLYKVEHGD
jgi:translocation and assembly module TamB